MHTRFVALVPVATILLLDFAGAGLTPRATGVAEVSAQAPAPFTEALAGTTVSFEMVPVPGGAASVEGKSQTVRPFYIGRTEVTWDLYDVFALGLDTPAAGDADAQARPSQPYGAPDMGWGHAGYPVINVTRDAAEAFAAWLSKKTGRTYRLPTEAEWARAAALAAGPKGIDRARLDEIGWHAGNSGGRTHAAASKERDALGLHDLFGNAAEWVSGTAQRAVRGGSFRDEPATMRPDARLFQEPSWNDRDPQLPKSKWWLPDAPFVGFRLVAEHGQQ